MALTWKVEVLQSGVWTDVTSSVREDPGVNITVGVQAEGGTADANTATMILNRTAGAVAAITRGTPLRVSVGSSYRFSGFVSECPVRWNEYGNVVWIPLVAAGTLRRLAHASLLESTIVTATRALVKAGNPITGYWPAEDAPGSTVIASALASGTPGTITGSPVLSSVDPGVMSQEIPTWNSASAQFNANSATSTSFTAGAFVVMPNSGLSGGEQIFRADVAGTLTSWRILYSPGSGGGLLLQVMQQTTSGLVEVYATTVITGINGQTFYLKLEVINSGSNANWALSALGLPSGGFASGSIAGSVGAPQVAYIGGGTIALAGGVAVGHVILASSNTALFDATFDAGRRAYAGESVDARMARLSSQTGVPIAVTSGATTPVEMGAQPEGTLLDALRAAEKADAGGILYDALTSTPSLAYIARTARYNDRQAQLVLNYNSGHLTPPLEPTRDDQFLTNDVTASRTGGSSARAVLASGALSVQDWPNGVGPYPTADEYAVYLDSQLFYLAGWVLGFGTIDETRWPVITVDLIKNSGLVATADPIRPGFRVQLQNIPAWIADGPTIDLQVVGWREYINSNLRNLELVCVPATPFEVMELDDTPFGELDVMRLGL